MDGKSLTPQEEKLKQLQAILPEAFTEGKVDWEKLQATLGKDINFANERYVLNWAGKSDAFKAMQQPSTRTLVPAKDESIDFDTTQNIFIEGENLEVLKILQKSYFGKVKMIYIDPPYNTGKDSFIYPDKFSETKDEYKKRVGDKDEEGYLTREGMFQKNSKESGQYHSNWLNMMYPRLFLAKNLLTEDGVIFVSIDDHEAHNLRLLMNEIFGEENFINEFIWKNGRTSSAIYTKEQEYIFAFAKHVDSVGLIKYEGGDEIISDRAIKKIGVKNPASEITFKKGIRFDSPDAEFPSSFGDSEVVTVTKGKLIAKDGKLAQDVTLSAGWVMKDMIEDWLEGKDVVDSKGQKVSEFFFKDNGVLQYVKEKGTIHPKTVIEGISTKSGTNEVKNLMGFKAFDYPKPIKLLQYLLQITDKDSLCLDFFAGSGSLAHSLMALNVADGGRRKCISVQLPEKCDKNSEALKNNFETIAEVAKERIRKSSKALAKKNPEKVDLGFKVFKLHDSNFKQWQMSGKDAAALQEQMKLFVDPVSKDASTANMVYELLLKSGKDLNSSIEKKGNIYLVNGNELALLLEKADQVTIDQVLKSAPEKVIALDRLFEDNDQLKTNTALQMKDAGIEFKTI